MIYIFHLVHFFLTFSTLVLLITGFSFFRRFAEHTREAQRLVDSFQIHENKLNILLSKIQSTYEKIKDKENAHARVWSSYFQTLCAELDSIDNPVKKIKKIDDA